MSIKVNIPLTIICLFIASLAIIIPKDTQAACNPAQRDDCVTIESLGEAVMISKTVEEVFAMPGFDACYTEEAFLSPGLLKNNYYVTSPRSGYRYTAPIDFSPSTTGFRYFFCHQNVIEHYFIDPDTLVTGWKTDIIWFLNLIIILVGTIFLWLFDWASSALVTTLSMNSYIGHQFVRAGWPFVQGIANLGFILALLFIAAATTLRLDIGNGVKRLLPRLLIAALLINFSLVIGALIIDASRLLMAIEINALTGGNINNVKDIGKNLIETSGLSNGMVLGKSPGNHSWSIPLNLTKQVLLIGALTLGVVYIAILLIIRHIALLLLLCFSPFAYLAFAIPKADNLARKWWTEFLKWALYGPIVLFFLLLISFVGNSLHHSETDAEGKTLPISAGQAMVNVGITAAMLIVAAKAGTSLAGAGGAAAVNMTTKGTKRAAGWAARNPGKAGLAAGVLTGGVAPVLVGAGAAATKGTAKAAYYQGRDFRKSAGKGIQNQWNKSIAGTKGLGWTKLGTRNKDGDLKPGESSVGQRRGDWFNPKERDKNKAAANHLNQLTTNIDTPDNIQIPSLENRIAAQKLTNDQAAKLTIKVVQQGHHNEDFTKAQAIMNNPEMVRKISDNADATQEIYNSHNNDLIRSFNQMRRRLEDQDSKNA